MKQLLSVLLFIATVFFLNGCGSNDNSGDTPSDIGFTYGMVEGQTIYTFDEKDNLWIRVLFEIDGQLIYEILEGKETVGLYGIEDGKIVVSDNDKDPVIALDSTESTIWQVTGTDNDGKVWQDTWYLEQKFTSEMIVGKRFLSEYDYNDVSIKEEVFFSETIIDVYDTDGSILKEVPYTLSQGVITIMDKEGEFDLYLMFIEPDGKINAWYSGEGRSDHNTLSPI